MPVDIIRPAVSNDAATLADLGARTFRETLQGICSPEDLGAFHGGGHGAALMQASTDLARAWGADLLWLGVWEHNDKALAFYARCGFREVGEHIFNIGNQVDRDLLLAKELS